MVSDEINHSGILGQKWGIRRYQNEDGTYTDAGKARKRGVSISDLRKVRNATSAVNSIASIGSTVTVNKSKNDSVRTKYDSEISKAKANNASKKEINDIKFNRNSELSSNNLNTINKVTKSSANVATVLSNEEQYKKGAEYAMEILGIVGNIAGIMASGVVIAKTIKDMKNAKD